LADNQENQEVALATTEVTAPVSQWLTSNGFEHEFLELDKQGIPILKIDRQFLLPFSTALYAYGFNYIRHRLRRTS
jgi:NAD(P)H-quinone oxidoreductase subunit J